MKSSLEPQSIIMFRPGSYTGRKEKPMPSLDGTLNPQPFNAWL